VLDAVEVSVLHVSVYERVPVVVYVIVFVPERGRLPDHSPDAVHFFALDDVQANFVAEPTVTVSGVAVKVSETSLIGATFEVLIAVSVVTGNVAAVMPRLAAVVLRRYRVCSSIVPVTASAFVDCNEATAFFVIEP
jgi:hypothetical protein